MTIPETDPFSQVHNALWEMAMANTDLRDLILSRNQIRYDQEDSQKDQISSADTPELALLSVGGDAGRYDNSTETTVVRNYAWVITSGDFRINEVYNKIAFELFRALVKWPEALCPLTWKGRQFVNKFRLLSVQEGLMMKNLDRGIRGWSGLWDCEVNFSFCTKDLK